MGIRLRFHRRFSQTDPEGLLTLFTATGIQQQIACDSKDPCPGVILVPRYFLEPPPNDQKCLGHDILGIRRICSALNEFQEVGVCGLI